MCDRTRRRQGISRFITFQRLLGRTSSRKHLPHILKPAKVSSTHRPDNISHQPIYASDHYDRRPGVPPPHTATQDIQDSHTPRDFGTPSRDRQDPLQQGLYHASLELQSKVQDSAYTPSMWGAYFEEWVNTNRQPKGYMPRGPASPPLSANLEESILAAAEAEVAYCAYTDDLAEFLRGKVRFTEGQQG